MPVIVNERSGTVQRTEPNELSKRVSAAFDAHGVGTEVHTVPGDRIAQVASEECRRGCDAVIAGGGDGTISAVAGVLAGTGIPLGVLPLGTLNHFARDLGIPGAIEDAIAVIAGGHRRTVDMGDVNGRLFLNTCLVGTYPRMIMERDSVRPRHPHGKWAALAIAAARVLSRRPVVRASIEINGESIFRRTHFVFVGNNRYEPHLFSGQHRTSLDEGVLSVLSPRCIGLLCLSRIVWRAMRNRLRESDEFDVWQSPKFRLRLDKPTVRVAVDGEVIQLHSPLEYCSRPGVLRVFAAKESA